MNTPTRCQTCGKSLKGRTNRQNSYMWGVVYQVIAGHTGHSTEEVHEYMKAMFLPRYFIRIGKREQEVRKSTAELSTSEMEEYLARVRVFASQDLGLLIPLPNEPPVDTPASAAPELSKEIDAIASQH